MRKKATKRKTTKKRSTKKSPAKSAPAAGSEEEAIVAALRELRGESAAIFGGQVLSEVREVIPTGIYVLDQYVIGIGGLPVGRVVELAAEEGGGKTSMAIAAIAQCQRRGGLTAYIDAEYSVSRERFEVFGADLNKCIFSQPDSLEDALEDVKVVLDHINPERGPNLIVVDSIAAAAPQRLLDGHELKPGEAAAIITARLKPAIKKLAQKRTCLLGVNQIRESIGAGPFKPDTYTPGGRYWKHILSLRLHIWGGKRVVDKNERLVGKDVTFQAVKNRLAGAMRKARVRLLFDEGWDDGFSSFAAAKEHGLIPKALHDIPKNRALALAELEAEWSKS